MINYEYSNEENSVFESITYQCDKCNKAHIVKCMGDYDTLMEKFDFEDPDESVLYCWKCSPNKPKEV